jgi:hypothetical protein
MKVKYAENVPELKKRSHPDDDCENRNQVNVSRPKKKNDLVERKVLEEINHQEKMEQESEGGVKKVKTGQIQKEITPVEKAKEDSFFMLIKHHQEEFIKNREFISEQIGIVLD